MSYCDYVIIVDDKFFKKKTIVFFEFEIKQKFKKKIENVKNVMNDDSSIFYKSLTQNAKRVVFKKNQFSLLFL